MLSTCSLVPACPFSVPRSLIILCFSMKGKVKAIRPALENMREWRFTPQGKDLRWGPLLGQTTRVRSWGGGGASWLPLGVTRQMAVPHVLVVRTQSPDGQEKGSKLVLPNPDGLGAELPLPHVLINFWCWAGTVSQVKVMHALCSFNCTVVNFVEFFHDKLQIRANMRSSCKTPEQGGQVQQDGHQQQDVGEKLKNRGADHAINRPPPAPTEVIVPSTVSGFLIFTLKASPHRLWKSGSLPSSYILWLNSPVQVILDTSNSPTLLDSIWNNWQVHHDIWCLHSNQRKETKNKIIPWSFKIIPPQNHN